ncbi:MAG: lipopolysaccharide biosynthesis protein [Methylocystis sp.]|nr:lipopolysaccharide biosynthesis protein [Methylocystis sp.]MCA3585340.1 lipopolysaccharide biosynthesis protein [Methylocystis sp.]MCA3589605.1 lipopolysaccharide biosynthesis protein [Methylocystis sp.]MCA3591547.1 lipopolysaccharide biosynthesis protein [Methylocystis sp.]
MPLTSADRGEIDLSALFREIGRKKWLVMAVTLLALVLSTVAVNRMSPRYTAETRVLLENRDTEYTRIGRDGSPQIDQDAVLSQVQLIQSRDIARTIIERFNLVKNPEFGGQPKDIDQVTKVMVMLGLIAPPAGVSPEGRVMDKYFDNLKAFPLARSRVVAVEFQSKDPVLATKITDAIAEEYLRELERAKKTSARSAGSWLGRTIENLRERVSAAEAKVEEYRTQNSLFMTGRGEGSNISSQQLSELNAQLAAARAQQTDLTSKARMIREAVRQGKVFEVSDIVNNEVVRRLIETRATLKAQIAQEERTLLPQHPRMKELYAQLRGLEDQIRNAAERTARALENDARSAVARVAASQAELDIQKRLSGTANEQEVQLRALEREAKAEREQLENYLARYRDASVRDMDNAVVPDARIISRATVPSSPSFPKRLPIIIIATLAGFCISLFWILTRALLSNAVYAPQTPEPAASAGPSAGMPPEMHPQVIAALAQAYGFASAPDGRPPMAAATAHDPAVGGAGSPDKPEANLSAASLAMQTSLRRMGAALKSTPAPAGQTVPQAPPLAPRTADIAGPVDGAKAAVPPPPSMELENPLFELADKAAALLAHGRPVSILVLSVASAEHSALMVAALEAVLATRGPCLHATLDPGEITPAGLRATANSLAEHHHFVLFNGGVVGAASAALARAATLTLLAASEDLDDPRVGEAGEMLAGCDYVIIGEESAAELLPG